MSQTRNLLFIPVFIFCICTFSLNTVASAQQELYALPAELIPYPLPTEQSPTLTLTHGTRQLRYLPNQGWYDNYNTHYTYPVPQQQAGQLFTSITVLAYFGIRAPILSDLRYSQNYATATLRIVLDVDTENRHALNNLLHYTSVTPQQPVTLRLPPLVLPLHVPSRLADITLRLSSHLDYTELHLSAARSMQIHAFSLDNPSRLVLDLTPYDGVPLPTNALKPIDTPVSPLPYVPVEEQAAQPDHDLIEDTTPVTEALGHGVVYKRFSFPTERRSSLVHVLEIDPTYGYFQVVGESYVPRSIDQLASGAFAAINAGYFDPKTHTPIGLLRVDYTTLSPASRGRASIAFDYQTPLIERVTRNTFITFRDTSYPIADAADPQGNIYLHTQAGTLAGDSSMGALVVQQDYVLANKVGPQPVPENGFVVTYHGNLSDITFRELAKINPGDYVTLEARVYPEAFTKWRYAVEAGPLLIKDGVNAYQPEREQFKSGYIVNGRTLQAAVGVKADGTVLFVTANRMTAPELIPLFEYLGAQHAMRLDSGSSSMLYAGNKLLNRRRGKRIISAIVFTPHELAQQ